MHVEVFLNPILLCLSLHKHTSFA